jgi:hypothetical protein
VIFGLLGIGLILVAGVVGIVHWAIAAVFPLLAAFFLWGARRPVFRAEFTDTGLQIDHPAISIPYERLEGLRAVGFADPPPRDARRSFPIDIFHEEGVVRIPPGLNVASADVYHFLYAQFPASGARDINPLLTAYLGREEEASGPEAVYTYRARRHLARNTYPRGRAFFLAMMLAGISWMVIALFRPESPGWMAPGVLALIIGGSCSLFLWLDRRRTQRLVRNWRQASLIIAPHGLAMIQGDLKGELRWDEILEIHLNNKPHASFRASSVTPGAGITLKVQAAHIFIADIYDRPLPLIYTALRSHYE